MFEKKIHQCGKTWTYVENIDQEGSRTNEELRDSDRRGRGGTGEDGDGWSIGKRKGTGRQIGDGSVQKEKTDEKEEQGEQRKAFQKGLEFITGDRRFPPLFGNYLDIVQRREGGVYCASQGGWQVADAVVLQQHPLHLCLCVCARQQGFSRALLTALQSGLIVESRCSVRVLERVTGERVSTGGGKNN